MDQTNRDSLLERGWKRHSIIETSSDLGDKIKSGSPEIIKHLLETEDALIVLTTYDCAVVNSCFHSEPWVQVLIITPVVFNRQYANAKNPRTIHFEIDKNGEPQTYQATASGFYQFEREFLSEYSPSTTYCILETTSFNLKLWLAERFRQDTWPDKLNEAVKPAERRLKRLWRRYNNYASAFYLKLDTDSEKENNKYIVSLIMAIESRKHRKFIKHVKELSNGKCSNIDEINNFVIQQIITAFGDTIEFEPDPTNATGKAIAIISEDNLTLTQLREFKIFSPYYLSEFGSGSPFPLQVAVK